MATTKRRLNLSLPTELDNALARISKREGVPQAAKAIYFLQIGLELEEDVVLNKIAEERDTRGAKYLSHEAVWK